MTNIADYVDILQNVVSCDGRWLAHSSRKAVDHYQKQIAPHTISNRRIVVPSRV